VSQHLKILKEADLVSEERKGTRNYYRLSPEGLGALREFIEDYWHIAIGSFKTFAEESAKAESQINSQGDDT
jgi:DNA-binding transcriptional ArsR family regulator